MRRASLDYSYKQEVRRLGSVWNSRQGRENNVIESGRKFARSMNGIKRGSSKSTWGMTRARISVSRYLQPPSATLSSHPSFALFRSIFWTLTLFPRFFFISPHSDPSSLRISVDIFISVIFTNWNISLFNSAEWKPMGTDSRDHERFRCLVRCLFAKRNCPVPRQRLVNSSMHSIEIIEWMLPQPRDLDVTFSSLFLRIFPLLL